MSDIENKRQALLKVYNANFVKNLKDTQVIAIYLRLKAKGEI